MGFKDSGVLLKDSWSSLQRNRRIAFMSLLLFLVVPRNGHAWNHGSAFETRHSIIRRLSPPRRRKYTGALPPATCFISSDGIFDQHCSTANQWRPQSNAAKHLSRLETTKLWWRSGSTLENDDVISQKDGTRRFSSLAVDISALRTTISEPIVQIDTETEAQTTAAAATITVLDSDVKTEPNDDPMYANAKLSNTVDIGFRLTAPFPPAGDQPEAIRKLLAQLRDNCLPRAILRGSTGTGKTLVMSHVIAGLQKPTLVLCHNKTLAAQLARELRSFLGQHSAVELFVSYYDHFMPESFKESTGKYIAKKSSINSNINALRHSATRALATRRDVVVVATVSCIYGIGLPQEYLNASVEWEKGQILYFNGERQDDNENNAQQSKGVFLSLRIMRYKQVHSDEQFEPGTYQHLSLSPPSNQQDHDMIVQQHQITLWPPHDQFPVKMWFDEHQMTSSSSSSSNGPRKYYRIASLAQGTAQGMVPVQSLHIFPAAHHVLPQENLERACCDIEEELRGRMKELKDQGRADEAIRLQERVLEDVYNLRENGFCSGMENYSRLMAGRQPGEPPDTLLDFMAEKFSTNKGTTQTSDSGNSNFKDWLLIVDESHVTLPQVAAMFLGDQSRKRSLIAHGYRLPSALDNRPLKEDEFWACVTQTLFVSATPGRKELDMLKEDNDNLLGGNLGESKLEPVDMVIRPTHVCDPIIEVRAKTKSIQDLTQEIHERTRKRERVLAVTLTKRDSEDLASYLVQQDINATYIHSGVKTDERSARLRQLQNGEIDCLVGVNCLREGLDLPEVSLVAVLNADAEGFLRSDTALLQVVGRAARNKNGLGIFYADRVTDSMKRCMDLTSKRRQIQLAYNSKNGFEPRSTKGSSTMSLFELLEDQIKAEGNLKFVGANKDTLEITGELDLQDAILGRAGGEQEQTRKKKGKIKIYTDHIPSSPGVYFWKDKNGKIMYIGKASKLRARIRSYLSPNARHGIRIQTMIDNAASVEFILTPSDRDALVLESKLIKRHRPRYNVLMKDDEHYPYICATIGDQLPRFSVVPHIHTEEERHGRSKSTYRYFGPYTSYSELNRLLDMIEEKYGLREKSFLVRQGSGSSAEEYKAVFEEALSEVFTSKSPTALQQMRSEYEEAGLLFESPFNRCRDVVAVIPTEGSNTETIVHVVQLRQGCVVGEFSYTCEIGSGMNSEVDMAEALQVVLETRHYPSGGESSESVLSWFPDEVLLPFDIPDPQSLRNAIKDARRRAEPGRKGSVSVRTPINRGARAAVDRRAQEFATANAAQEAARRALDGSVSTSIDGTALKELAGLLSFDSLPSRIECYDISHTQGEQAVGARVVFVDGKPVPSLYRTFNIKTVHGVDDYSSLTEVLRRRFARAQKDDSGTPVEASDPWAIPDLVLIDGGRGQLGAAMKGISEAYKHNFPHIPICALAKEREEVFVPNQSNPVNDSPTSPALLLLRHLRDESHRFAIKSHRNRRSLRNSR
ncbi:hypothetical protein ACA910_005861 [Epithemia clementina (nom. ined.)]